jgi:4-amino-4-deoxy-L-arabinose transferase-like glycosyltransferase
LSEKEFETSPESRKLAPVVYAGWFAGLWLILVFHVVWEYLNDMPPVWDMAYHELMGWNFLTQLEQGESLLSVAFLTDYYPPLQYFIEASILRIFGETEFFSLLSNLPGIVLLSFSTFRIAAMFLRPVTSVLVGWIVLLFPMVTWLSRVSLLDVPLAGWVAASLLSILFSQHFTRAKWVVVFGLCCVFGMLTKWTFVLFIVGPVFFTILDSSTKRRTLLNLAITAVVALPMVLWWYWPNIGSLYGRFQVTAGQASWEQDPGIFKVLNDQVTCGKQSGDDQKPLDVKPDNCYVQQINEDRNQANSCIDYYC